MVWTSQISLVGYSSHDPDVMRKQIRQAKAMGISGFVVDWYGYREPFIDHSYALMQTVAAEEKFHVAMMYDETDDEEGATDESIEDFKLFKKTYLAPMRPADQAYLTYNGRPVIFIFPKKAYRLEQGAGRSQQVGISRPCSSMNIPPASSRQPSTATTHGSTRSSGGNGSNWGEQYLNELLQHHAVEIP